MPARRRATKRSTRTTRTTRTIPAKRQSAAARPTPSAPATRARAEGSGVAPGMHAVNTYLAVENVAASMEFLERAFGFARGVVLAEPDGPPRYAEMRYGNS